jgi:hypothetical protein
MKSKSPQQAAGGHGWCTSEGTIQPLSKGQRKQRRCQSHCGFAGSKGWVPAIPILQRYSEESLLSEDLALAHREFARILAAMTDVLPAGMASQSSSCPISRGDEEFLKKHERAQEIREKIGEFDHVEI